MKSEEATEQCLWCGLEVPYGSTADGICVECLFQQPTRRRFQDWTLVDWWVLTLCLIATVYLVVHVIVWVL